MESPSFADRLNRLFATVHPRGRGPHTPHEVAAAINDEGIVTISSNHVSQLRSGRSANPSAAHVDALARFFHVRTHYFSDADYADSLDQELDYLVALRDAGVQSITNCRVLDRLFAFEGVAAGASVPG